MHEKKRRCGLFLERLWRVGELNTADTCQGFWGCNRGTFRKKGCLANEHRRIRMAGRERMHTKRFWRSSETSRETHFHVFPLYPRASERASACLRRCGESWERRPAPPSPLRPRAKRLPRVNKPDPERPPLWIGCRAPCHGRLPSIFNSSGRHLGPHANLCDRRRFPAHLQWCSEHTLPPFLPVFSRTTPLTSSVSCTGKFSNDKSEPLSLSTPGQRHSQSVSRISVDSKKNNDWVPFHCQSAFLEDRKTRGAGELNYSSKHKKHKSWMEGRIRSYPEGPIISIYSSPKQGNSIL